MFLRTLGLPYAKLEYVIEGQLPTRHHCRNHIIRVRDRRIYSVFASLPCPRPCRAFIIIVPRMHALKNANRLLPCYAGNDRQKDPTHLVFLLVTLMSI